MELNVNVIKFTADAFDWTLETASQSLRTFLDGNYFLVAHIISVTCAVLKSVAETLSFSGYVLQCYYLDFLAFLSELGTGISLVLSTTHGFCSRIILSVLLGIARVWDVISSLYFNITFAFHLTGQYISLCVEGLAYFLNVGFAAVLLLLQLGPNFLIFLCSTLLLFITETIAYLHFIALFSSNYGIHLCYKCFSFVLTIPLKAYCGLLILIYLYYSRKTIFKYLKKAFRLLVAGAVILLVSLWTAIRIISYSVITFVSKIFRGRSRRNERTLNLFSKRIFKRYFSTISSYLTFFVSRKDKTQCLEPAEKEKFMCVVCQDKEKNVLLIPCRHLCLCEDCTRAVLQSYSGCPLCRNQILDTVRVYT